MIQIVWSRWIVLWHLSRQGQCLQQISMGSAQKELERAVLASWRVVCVQNRCLTAVSLRAIRGRRASLVREAFQHMRLGCSVSKDKQRAALRSAASSRRLVVKRLFLHLVAVTNFSRTVMAYTRKNVQKRESLSVHRVFLHWRCAFAYLLPGRSHEALSKYL